MKKIFVSALILPLLFNCGGEEKEKEEAQSPAVEETTPVSNEPEKPKVKRNYKPNEVIETKTGLSVRFLEISADTKLGTYDKADEGMLIRSVKVEVVNNTEEDVKISPYDFKLVDSDGNDYGQDFTQGKEPQLTTKEIRPGKKLVGYVEFEQSPADADGFEIKYSPKGEYFYIEFGD